MEWTVEQQRQKDKTGLRPHDDHRLLFQGLFSGASFLSALLPSPADILPSSFSCFFAAMFMHPIWQTTRPSFRQGSTQLLCYCLLLEENEWIVCFVRTASSAVV